MAASSRQCRSRHRLSQAVGWDCTRAKKGRQFTEDDDALLRALGAGAEAKKATYTPKQERVIAGFEDIQRFYREHGRHPQHGEGRDIFERLYAVRLDRIREMPECLELLGAMDADGLLARAGAGAAADDKTDDELLEALGVGADAPGDVTVLKHVRSNAERMSPEEVAQREPCADFERFRPLFESVQVGLAAGEWRTTPFKGRGDPKIQPGDWYILDGQKAYVAGADAEFVQDYGETDRRLRVIFDNGTESDLLMRSLRRALNKDEQSRRILPPEVEAGSLFSGELSGDDTAVGTIYVARSLSDHPFVAEHREVVHKIGVTSGDPKRRVAGAKKDPTFLLADAELVAVYTLANLHPGKLERLLHRVFDTSRLDVGLKDRFGGAVEPREWFLVPLAAIDEAISRIKDGSIDNFTYDQGAGRLVPIPTP